MIKNKIQVIRLVKLQYFCGAIALIYLVENCLDLPNQYLSKEDISKVLVSHLVSKSKSIYIGLRVYNLLRWVYVLKICANLVLFTNTYIHT